MPAAALTAMTRQSKMVLGRSNGRDNRRDQCNEIMDRLQKYLTNSEFIDRDYSAICLTSTCWIFAAMFVSHLSLRLFA